MAGCTSGSTVSHLAAIEEARLFLVLHSMNLPEQEKNLVASVQLTWMNVTRDAAGLALGSEEERQRPRSRLGQCPPDGKTILAERACSRPTQIRPYQNPDTIDQQTPVCGMFIWFGTPSEHLSKT